MVRRAEVLRREGYGVLLIDLRAHGESPGTRITFGAKEADDAAASVAFIRSRAPGQPIAAIGWSLGGNAFQTFNYRCRQRINIEREGQQHQIGPPNRFKERSLLFS